MSRTLLAAALALVAAGCNKAYKKGPDFDVAVPQRVAVLPFGDRTGKETVTSAPFTAALDAIPLTSTKFVQTPATMLRNRFLANLYRTRLDVVQPEIVDAALLQHKLFDVMKLSKVPPAKLGQLLSADLLVYGMVTDWDRVYYVAESRVVVAMHVKIVDVASGKTVYEIQEDESKTSGLRGGPTGYTSAALEPIKGLSNTTYVDLCNALARKTVDPLVAETKGQVQAEAPPFIAAALHTGGSRTLAPGDVLDVYLVGSPGGQASFRVGPAGAPAPMTEFGAGRYRGSYVVQPGDRFQGAVVEVVLVRAGRKTAADLAHAPVSSAQ